MILVPAGSFLAGDKKEPAALPAFYIDKSEVSNAAYAKFCEAKSRPLPPGFPSDRPNDPVANITVVDAQEFAKWAGKRLPTAIEWEKAARGTDGRKYPWGDDEDPARSNVKNNPQLKGRGVQPVTEFSNGASPLGALNMSGNVWEFVDELRTPSPGALARFAEALDPPPTAQEPWYVAKGGAYNWPLAAAAVYEWVSIPARLASPDIGFRCAKDP
jgi:serine/threonine-protein kinase